MQEPTRKDILERYRKYKTNIEETYQKEKKRGVMKAKHKKLLIENRDYIYNKSSLRDGSNIAIFLVWLFVR